MSTNDPQHDLATFVSELTPARLPSAVVEHVADLFVDSIACAVAAPSHPEFESVASVARLFGVADTCTVLGSEERLSAAGATFLNGYGATAWTMCDAHAVASSHLMPAVLPPVLALAEARQIGGQQVLTAAAAGLEVGARLGHAMGGLKSNGWHPPGLIGAVAAGAAVGNLLRLSPTVASHALSLAASQASGPMSAWPTPAVKLHQFHAALAGLVAGTLAEAGFSAPDDELTAPGTGLIDLTASDPRPYELTAELGSSWRLGEVRMRAVPGGVGLQPMIRVLRQLAQEVGTDRTERVMISLSSKVHEAHAGVGWPRSSFEALLSVPFIAATVLCTGDLWLDDLDPTRPSHSAIYDLAAAVTLRTDPALQGPQCRVEVVPRNGIAVSGESLDTEPLPLLSRQDVIRKLARCAGFGQTHGETAATAEDLYGALASDDAGALRGAVRALSGFKGEGT